MKNEFLTSGDPEAEASLSKSMPPSGYDQTVLNLQNQQALYEELRHRHLNAEHPFANSLEAWKSEVIEYEKLISRDYLSEEEADQLELILEKAQSNNRLSFWLSRADEIVLEKKKGLLSDDQILSYQEDQKSLRKSLKEKKNLHCSDDCCLDK